MADERGLAPLFSASLLILVSNPPTEGPRLRVCRRLPAHENEAWSTQARVTLPAGRQQTQLPGLFRFEGAARLTLTADPALCRFTSHTCFRSLCASASSVTHCRGSCGQVRFEGPAPSSACCSSLGVCFKASLPQNARCSSA